MDATAQAGLVRRREVSAVELTEAAIRRIERLNPALNAVVTPLFDAALEQARSIDRLLNQTSARDTAGALEQADAPPVNGIPPFAGVPLLFKDLNDLAGAPTTSGSRFFLGRVAAADSEAAARFRQAGFVFVGKSNTPELGLLPTTEPALFGPTRNPWDLGRTPGGSSGGAAAAVASGMVPVAHANDGGGSIRIPASCCGLFGLKPSRGRTPGNTVTGLAVNHVVTRSVRDSAAILDCLSGPMPWTPYPIPAPETPFAQARLARRLRIGFSTTAPTGAPVHPDCAAAVHQVARLCEKLGHHVEEAEPEIDGERVTAAFMQVWGANCAAAVDGRAAELGRRPQPEELEPLTWALAEVGWRMNASDLLLAQGRLHEASRRFVRFFDAYDLWLTPTLAAPPVPLGTFDPASTEAAGDPMKVFAMTNAWVPFTPIVNVTGQPAMSVPLFWNAANLPIGVHFVGRFADEATLLGLAFELEADRPWSGRRPPPAYP